MIRSFRDHKTKALFDLENIKGVSKEIQIRIHKKLLLLDAAQILSELESPPGSTPKKLRGDRKGQFSIRVNDQYRICFEWIDGNAYNVEFTDYHR